MSSRRFITQGEGLPQWSAPISHAVVVNNTCYVSGQVSVDVSGQYLPGSVREEAERSFANFFAAIKAAGFSNDEIVFVDLAFVDLADVSEINGLFAELFPEGKRPARTIYQAAALPFNSKIKVMGIAVKDESL
ncbi:RidA family protein [Phormidium tenue FACHB-886]|nr:RidA family protein [Phormidium tenue FACHB-886]